MAELKLRVSLDTSYLKGQISRLPLEFAGANVSIRPKFDRQAIVSEFRLLNRYIGGKKFNVVINTNLEAEIKNADRLIKALGKVQQAAGGAKGGLPIGTQVLSRTKTKGGFAAAEIKALFGAAVQGGLVDDKTLAATRAQMVAALGSIGKDSIAGLLNGLKSGDADIQAAAQALGSNLITSFKTVLGIASPSKEFKKLGEAAGQGFEQGLLKSIEIAEQSATRKMQRMLDRLARMALMMGGMSGPEIGRQIAQARALPSLNFGATTPRTSFAIGPSSTGRALPSGADRLGLPGTSFASQKLLSGDLLTPSMKAAIRDAANEFVDNLRGSLNNAIREVNVRDLGRMGAPMLGGVRTAGFLPAGVGRPSNPYGTGRLGREGETRAELFARREREARMRSALRGVDAMGEGGMAGRGASPYSYAYRGARPQSAIVPYERGGAMVYSGPGGGGMPPRGGAYGGPGNFARRGGGPGGDFNMPKLPGAGLVREIGQEFGFATKQVLLFGSAYKALAFLQSFPTQVGAAVGALQSFRNTLNAISPTAADAAASNQLIIDTVDKYNIPIQSARDGFTKLYASMKPAGFSGNQIGDLFLGISKASATLGLSSDKVDRVTYAFSQMASKGQLMSEEVSGQLGDVIPGALSIMAEAANMDIKTFKKAMEDGVFVGKEFEAVMSNVPIVLEKRFGKGAEGAAKTFQGAINNMQTSLTLFYEAFEPVAVGFLDAVVKPISAGLQTLTDGFNAFFTGQAAQTAAGSAFAEQLNNLRPSFEGIRTNLAALIPSLQTFGKLLLSVAQLLASVAGNPITGFLLKVYANVLLVNTAFTLLGGRILLGLIANINAAIIRFVAFGYAINAVGIQTTGANTALAGTQLQMMLLQRNAGAALAPVNTLLGSLARMAAIGTIAIAVTIVVNGLTELKDAQDRINRLRGARDPVGPSGPVPIMTAERRYTGATRERVTSDQQKQVEYLAQLRGELTKLQATQTKAGSALSQTALGNLGNVLGGLSRENINAKITETKLRIKDAEEVVNLNPRKFRTAAEQQRVTTSATVSGGGGGAGGDAGSKPDKARESQIPQLTLALEKTKELSVIEMQIVNAQLMNNTAQLSALELAKQLVNFKYEEKELELQKLTAGEQAIAKKEIGLRREQAILASQLQLQIDFRKEREAVQEGFVAILAGYDEEFEYQQMYLNLINQGIRPSLAKARVEVEKTFRAQEKSLDTLIDQNKANIAGLEVDIARFKLKKDLSPIEKEQLRDAEARLEAAKNELAVRTGLKDIVPETKAAAMQKVEQGLAPKTSAEYMGEGLESAEERLAELTNTGYQVAQAANAIGDAFGEAFKGVITGSMTAREALAGFFQGVADHFADMVAQMIAEYLKMALIKGIMSIIGGAAGALGGGLSSGFNAGTSSAIDTGATGWANSLATPLKLANGGIAPGGFTAFANGGVVTGPTLGLVGEGKYNEAVIPLPDGKSVPVQLSGGDGGNQINSNITVNVSNGQAQSNATGSNSSELGRKIEGAVKQVIVGELRPGGLLASR
jgi:tape measure domain-containing protein